MCTPGMWSEWSGDVPQGSCATQKRKQPYVVSWTNEVQIGSCDGVAKSCDAPIADYRKRCKKQSGDIGSRVVFRRGGTSSKGLHSHRNTEKY